MFPIGTKPSASGIGGGAGRPFRNDGFLLKALGGGVAPTMDGLGSELGAFGAVLFSLSWRLPLGHDWLAGLGRAIADCDKEELSFRRLRRLRSAGERPAKAKTDSKIIKRTTEIHSTQKEDNNTREIKVESVYESVSCP